MHFCDRFRVEDPNMIIAQALRTQNKLNKYEDKPLNRSDRLT